jgi:CheY-like chemotaxis protein
MASILVVDDQPVIQRVLAAQLRKNGHSSEACGCASDALLRLSESMFDLVILDIAMPEMDGLSLLRLLREDPRFAHMPAVMLTASGQDEDRAAAFAAGATAFLTKPTSSWELADTIDRALGRA